MYSGKKISDTPIFILNSNLFFYFFLAGAGGGGGGGVCGGGATAFLEQTIKQLVTVTKNMSDYKL